MTVLKDPETGKPMLLAGPDKDAETSRAIARIASDEGVTQLCAAIVKAAMHDYEIAYGNVRRMYKRPDSDREKRRELKKQTELSQWFHASMFIQVAGISPENLMSLIEDKIRRKQNYIEGENK